MAIQPSDKRREPEQITAPEPEPRETEPPWADAEGRARYEAGAVVPPSERTIRNARPRTIE